MISDLKLFRIGLFSMLAPTVLIVLPELIDSRLKLNIAPFSISNSVVGILMVLGICSALLPLVFGFWLIGRWLNPEERRGAEFLVFGILNLLTLPWLFAVWLIIGVMAYGIQLNF